jgi:hypothetical protein
MKLKKWNGSYRLLIKLIYDHNGEMYEIELEDGSTLLVESNNSRGEKTLTGDNLFSTLSPENIVHPNTKEVILYIQ